MGESEVRQVDGATLLIQDGTEYWFDKNGKFHRVDAPAIIWPDGEQEWYLHGERVDPIVVFLAGKDVNG